MGSNRLPNTSGKASGDKFVGLLAQGDEF